MNRILVTGASGFVGNHLVAHLLENKRNEIWCVVHRRAPSVPREARHRVRVVRADLLNARAIPAALRKAKPHSIYHLAAQASVALSWKSPKETFAQNVQCQLNLLEALRKGSSKAKILVTCSADEYGEVRSNELPVREENSFRPVSPYAVSKVAQDVMAYHYFRSCGLKVIRTRAFNHTGPGQSDLYAISSFAKQIALIERGLQRPVLQVGDLSVKRDYCDVRDVVRAYTLAVDRGTLGEVYNICSGKAETLRKMLDGLLTLTPRAIRVRKDPKRLRPSDMPILCGDPSKFRKRTGWRPHIPMSQTVQDLLNDWRRRV